MSETLEATLVVSQIVSETPRGVIFVGVDQDGDELRCRVSGRHRFLTPYLGQVVFVKGSREMWLDSPQLHLDVLRAVRPDRSRFSAIIKYLRVPGVGKAKKRKILAHGDAFVSMIESGDVSAVSKIVGGYYIARYLINSWEEMVAQYRTFHWVREQGLSDRLACRLDNVFGSNAIEKIRANPYRLLAFEHWRIVDNVGSRLNVAADAPQRLVGAVEAACYECLEEGHTAISEGDLHRQVSRLLGTEKLAKRARSLAVDEWRAVVQLDDGWVQPIGAFAMERRLAIWIREMLVQPPAALPFGDLEDALGEIELTNEQKAAVEAVLGHRLSLVAGGAGVGKTYVVKAIHAVAEKCGGGNIFQMALSGRAAARLAEITGHEAKTIAKFLLEHRQPSSLGSHPIIIVDEASMLDLPLLYQIFELMRDDGQIVLIGDTHQLSPIGFGAPFHALASCSEVVCSRLKTVLRQSDDSGIPAVADHIRNGEADWVAAAKVARSDVPAGPGVFVVDCSTEAAATVIKELYSDLGGVGNVQIISMTVDGPVGITELNRVLSNRLATEDFYDGEPVICTQNDYDVGIYNGTLGVVRKGKGFSRIDWGGDEDIVTDVSSVIGRIERAYALTCHKAQGSEFRTVIIPIFSHKRLLDRSMIYTALTRAREKVIFVGDSEALERAVEDEPKFSSRNTALLYHLTSSGEGRAIASGSSVG